MKSIRDARIFSTEEIIKCKMPVVDWALPEVRPAPGPKPGPPSSTEYVALSVDGSFSVDSGAASIGMILRRHDGSVIFAAYRYIFNCNDALEMEIHAIMQGMMLVIQRNQPFGHCPI